jgi:hypothetical protein
MAGQKEGYGEISCLFFTEKNDGKDSKKLYVILEEERGDSSNEKRIIAIGRVIKDKLF